MEVPETPESFVSDVREQVESSPSQEQSSMEESEFETVEMKQKSSSWFGGIRKVSAAAVALLLVAISGGYFLLRTTKGKERIEMAETAKSRSPSSGTEKRKREALEDRSERESDSSSPSVRSSDTRNSKKTEETKDKTSSAQGFTGTDHRKEDQDGAPGNTVKPENSVEKQHSTSRQDNLLLHFDHSGKRLKEGLRRSISVLDRSKASFPKIANTSQASDSQKRILDQALGQNGTLSMEITRDEVEVLLAALTMEGIDPMLQVQKQQDQDTGSSTDFRKLLDDFRHARKNIQGNREESKDDRSIEKDRNKNRIGTSAINSYVAGEQTLAGNGASRAKQKQERNDGGTTQLYADQKKLLVRRKAIEDLISMQERQKYSSGKQRVGKAGLTPNGRMDLSDKEIEFTLQLEMRSSTDGEKMTPDRNKNE